MALSVEILQHPDLQCYRMQISTDQKLFLEGDRTTDVYILIEGCLGVFRDRKKLADIDSSGVFIGEMSHLLNNKRTATVQAMVDSIVLKIPAQKINEVKCRFPQISMAMSRLLAERLCRADQVLAGHESLCDTLADAVFMTDRKGIIISCNQAAEALYGKSKDQIINSPAAQLCANPRNWTKLVQSVSTNQNLREQKIAIHHPKEHLQTISASITALYDGHHNVQGTLVLARDITHHERLLKSHRALRWIGILGSILLVTMMAAMFLGYPYFATAYREKNSNVAQIEKSIAVDLIRFKTLLGKYSASQDPAYLNMFNNYLNAQPDAEPLYTGIVLLDQFKHVRHVSRADFAVNEPEIPLGSSYSDIDFQGIEESRHYLLSLYRTSTKNPMGRKGLEVAFNLDSTESRIEWLVLQLNTDLLFTVFKIKEADLMQMRLIFP